MGPVFFYRSDCKNTADLYHTLSRCHGPCFFYRSDCKHVEYQAAVNYLRLLQEDGYDNMEIIGDSRLVINQLADKYECKNDVQPLTNPIIKLR
jgi:ribonuclease HI